MDSPDVAADDIRSPCIAVEPGTSSATQTELPHIYEHGVTEVEVREILLGRCEDVRGADDSRMNIGQTQAGRYLQVIYQPDPGQPSAFVITAYDLKPTAKKAYRRRQRRKGR